MEGVAKAEMDKALGVAVRENLNETAFFYPRLMADTSGVVTLRFTLPESLTTWKFMALAHTKDMMAGLLTDEVVAAKEVMAQLSLPRFVRMGDRATLSATLFNLTEKTLEGKATMEVFDPATGKGLWKETVKVEMEAKSDTAAFPVTDCERFAGTFVKLRARGFASVYFWFVEPSAPPCGCAPGRRACAVRIR